MGNWNAAEKGRVNGLSFQKLNQVLNFTFLKLMRAVFNRYPFAIHLQESSPSVSLVGLLFYQSTISK